MAYCHMKGMTLSSLNKRMIVSISIEQGRAEKIRSHAITRGSVNLQEQAPSHERICKIDGQQVGVLPRWHCSEVVSQPCFLVSAARAESITCKQYMYDRQRMTVNRFHISERPSRESWPFIITSPRPIPARC